MHNRERQARLTVFDFAIERPFFIEAQLFPLSELFLVLFLVLLAKLLNDLERRHAYRVILVIQTGDQIWKQCALMISLIGQSVKQIGHCVVEALANRYTSIGDKRGKVVQLG